jgi:hypothetical protein
MTAKCAFGLGFLGVIVLSSAGFTQSAVGATHKVTINNGCKTHPSKVIVSVNDDASWTPQDQDYTLLFPDSPFTGIVSATPFPVPTGAPKPSGPVTDPVKEACKDNDHAHPANPHCNFKYSVKGSVGANPCMKDPVVIVTK